MKKRATIQSLFAVAALYECFLGILFMLLPNIVFERFCITPPNHFAYIQFPAALLVIFGIMFVTIAINPALNRNLIPYGILLKLSYCGIICFYWLTSGIPQLWKLFALFDFLFLVMFVWAFVVIPRKSVDDRNYTKLGN